MAVRNSPHIQQVINFKRLKYANNVEITEAEVLDDILHDRAFGAIEIDIHIPEHLREYFKEFTHTFKNTEVEFKDIGDYMQRVVEDHGISKQPRKLLIGSYFGRQIGINTPLLRWYLQHGLEVARISRFIQYRGAEIFKSFVNSISQDRVNGDSNPDTQVKAETSKLVGNSAFGVTIINKGKQRLVSYLGAKKYLPRHVNIGNILDAQILENDIVEIITPKKKIIENHARYIGWNVFQYAKIRMLESYYDFLKIVLQDGTWELCEMDTDSLYIGFANGKRFEDNIRPELKGTTKYRELEKEFFVTDTDACPFGKRTPGKFKIEFEGEYIRIKDNVQHRINVCHFQS
eukprot:gene4117-biopygen2584